MTKEPQIKSNEAYKTISEVGKLLKLNTSTLRFWEKEFKQIKPRMINKRRYYSQENIHTIKMIKDLVYEKGYTLSGAKKYFENSTANIDTETSALTLKNKLKQLIEQLRAAKEKLKNNS
jgi:DNA-binding transcriptional MerR regulator